MFVSALIILIITGDLPDSHSTRIIFLVITWFALSLLINIKPIIGYFFHGDGSPATNQALSSKTVFNRASQIENKTQNPALPSAQVVPIADFVMPRGKTAEIVQPPSVTEETTNLLKNK